VFVEVAKFRAARRLWAEIMRDRFGARDERSLMLRFHAQTGGSTLTAQQPQNNVVRVALQAFSAAAGGCQSLHTNGYDEALALPTERSATLALRTQQVLAHESGVRDVADPFGGSYYVEALTDALEREARALIAHVDDLGGAVAAIESGWMQGQIEDEAYAFQERVERGEQILVGVNRHVDGPPDGVAIELHRLDPASEGRQVEAVQAVRAGRDAAAVERALGEVRAAAEDEGRNLLVPLREALAAYATVGEVCGALRGVWGTYDSLLAQRPARG
jgi:methylmalonyl-CoA mutase N-terminal domain/subunit